MLKRGWMWGLFCLAGCLGLTACRTQYLQAADAGRVSSPRSPAANSSTGLPAKVPGTTGKTTMLAAAQDEKGGRIETPDGSKEPKAKMSDHNKPKTEPPRSPIHWKPVEKTFPVTEERALELARKYCGFNEARKVTPRRVVLTDADAFFLDLKERLVWLVTFEGVTLARSRPSSTHPEECSLTIHLALDAKTGDCLEAFSEPRPEWVAPRSWSEMKKVLEGANVKYEPPHQPPHCTVKRALEVADPDPYQAGQVIARFVSFTDTGYGLEVPRSDGKQVVNFWVGKPAWALSYMGGYFNVTSGPVLKPGEPRPELYNTEWNVVIDDEGRKPLESFAGR